MKKIKKFTAVLLCLAFLSMPCGCKKAVPVTKTQYMLNTVITLTVYNNKDAQTLDGAFELCRFYENMLSRTVEGSDVYKINNANGEATEVNEATARLIEKALYYGELSQGRFDITTAKLSELWGFSGENPDVPDRQVIDNALEFVDYKKVLAEGNTVILPKGYAIDLGGIAKGYIADRLAEYFTQNGVKNAIIDLGGNIYALGDKEGEGYKIAIRSPFEGQATIGYVAGSNLTVVTSGAYERCFYKDGVRYHHILDVKTGMPAQSDLESVTIIASHSVDADALSTVCFLLGKEAGISLLEKTEGIEGVFVTSDGEIFCTEGANFTKT
ncbi:MAG: FAD:protein FMN transferase [Clostridia bacterium]|nr:FAD:protein FMN transferase [Clostridia bacterium]